MVPGSPRRKKIDGKKDKVQLNAIKLFLNNSKITQNIIYMRNKIKGLIGAAFG